MIRIRNIHTKDKLEFRTQSEMAKHFNCSKGMVANLIHGRTKNKTFAECWKLNKYPATKQHLRNRKTA